MARPKRAGKSKPPPQVADSARGGERIPALACPSPFELSSLDPPLFRDELVPVFMMIETDLYEQLNAKATARRTEYDMLLRTILREHVSAYGRDAGRPARTRAGKKGV